MKPTIERLAPVAFTIDFGMYRFTCGMRRSV